VSATVLLVSSMDPVLRETAIAILGCDLPDVAVLGYETLPDGGGLRRTWSASRSAPQVESVEVRDCLTCAVRADLRTSIDALLARGAVRIVVGLPVTMDPVPICFDLQREDGPVSLAASLGVLDANTLPEDLFGTDLLADRNSALGEYDRRSVGEALARQIETVDLLLLAERPDAHANALLDHVVGPVPSRCDLFDLDAASAFARRRPAELTRRGDLRIAAGTGAPNAHGVWTLDLTSWKPFHPQRLQDRLARLGGGRLRGRGYFWLPTRPQLQCAWDGAGGQLSIGELDRWDTPPSTRLVITGTDSDPRAVRRAFERSLLTDAELAAGLALWSEREDGLDLWLGPREEHCDESVDLLAEED
jgi:G3E family GTPase